MFAVEVSSVDALEQQALALVSEVGVRFGRLLPVLRELDAAQVATADGCRTLTEWVASRLDVTHDTARDLVHVARAGDVTVEADLVAGRVSWERAVATVGLKTAGAPEHVVSRSAGFDLAGVDRLASLYRRVATDQDQGTDRYLVVQPSLGDGTWKLWGQVPAGDGHLIEQALLARADQFPDPPVRVPRQVRMADALTSICLDALTGSLADGPDRSPMTADVFVDASVAAPTGGEAGARVVSGPRVGPRVLEEILCSGTVRVIVEDESGVVSAASNRSRAIPSATRAAVLHRDLGVCTVDGCRSRYRLQPHHIVPYADGGDHDPGNLTTACWYHHHIVIHTMRFRIDPASPPGRRRLRPPP